ncbi:MAG: glycosyltransferase [Promethearchaeota archaeon]
MTNRHLFKITFKENEKLDFNQIQNFIHVRIGFLIPQPVSSYPNYIDLDYYSKGNNFYIVNLKKLPFNRNSLEEISINHFFKYFPNKRHWKKALNNWNKLLIPGGKLKLLLNKNYKYEKTQLDQLKNYLRFLNYEILNSKKENCSESDIGMLYSLVFFKKHQTIEKSKITEQISKNKLDLISHIINNLKISYYVDKDILIIGRKQINFENLKKNAKNLKYCSQFSNLDKCNLDNFEFGIIYDSLEYFYRDDYQKYFQIIKSLFKPKSKLLLIVPNQQNFFMCNYRQLFNKSILTELIDNVQLEIKWINQDVSSKLIKTMIINEEPFPSTISPIKIAILGNLEVRYSQLNSFWDGHIRALKKLGYKPLLLDARAIPFSEILTRIKIYKPDYLLSGDYTARDFLIKYSEFFRRSNICVSYWYRDVRTPEDINFDGVINYMFLTNQGQLEEYKKHYNIKNVFYMPQWCNPQFTHPNPFINEIYEIGFAGQTDFYIYHKERTETLLRLKKIFKVKIKNAEFNSISEFFSQCKIIFGNDIGFHRLFGKYYTFKKSSFNKFVNLYASNRIFISIGCGACYFINYFPGIEKLFLNKKHLVWYKNYDELIELIKKFLSDNKSRLYIKREALKLAKEKHTHIHRIKNVLDIIMGKTKEFYGFLN